MSNSHEPSPVWLNRLRTPALIDNQHPIAARFTYAMRLLAVYQAAGRDAAAELAVRMESVTVAVHAVELCHQLLRAWPEPITVNRFCCRMLSHDEATIARMVNAAVERDKDAFWREGADLIRADRIARLWEHTIMLVGADTSSPVL